MRARRPGAGSGKGKCGGSTLVAVQEPLVGSWDMACEACQVVGLAMCPAQHRSAYATLLGRGGALAPPGVMCGARRSCSPDQQAAVRVVAMDG